MSARRLEKHNPDYVVDDLIELKAILQQEWGLGA